MLVAYFFTEPFAGCGVHFLIFFFLTFRYPFIAEIVVFQYLHNSVK